MYDTPEWRRLAKVVHESMNEECEVCHRGAYQYYTPEGLQRWDRLSVDHRLALANGGGNDLDNLALVHQSYNSSKGDSDGRNAKCYWQRKR